MVFRSLFNPTLLAYRLQCDGGRLGHPCHRSGILARPICRSFAGAAANNFLQDAVWPISTFHVGPDQPDPRPITLTLTLTPILWGARGRQGPSRGSAVCFGGFPKKPGHPKTQSRPIRLAPCRKLFAGSSCK